MRNSKKPREQVLRELRNAYEGGASIRKLVASTGRSYGSIHNLAPRCAAAAGPTTAPECGSPVGNWRDPAGLIQRV